MNEKYRHDGINAGGAGYLPHDDGMLDEGTRAARGQFQLDSGVNPRTKWEQASCKPIPQASSDESADTYEERMRRLGRRIDRTWNMFASKNRRNPQSVSIPVDTSNGDADEALDIIEGITQPFSLDAMAARKDLLDRLQQNNGLEKPLYRDDFRDITSNGGDFGTLQIPENEFRVVHKLGGYRGVSVLAWMDIETRRKHLWGREIENTFEDIEDSPITIGVAIGGVGRTLFVPIVKSFKTTNGCDIVLPDGAEIDDGAYNKPDILRLTKQISAVETPYNAVEVGQLIKKVRETVGFNQDLKNINELADRFLNDRPRKPIDTILPYIAEHAEASLVEVLPRSNSPDQAATIVAIETGVLTYKNNNERKLKYYLSMGDYTEDRRSGIQSRSFTMWTGLDPHEYVHTGPVIPRYRFTHDELNGLSLDKFDDTGINTQPATDKDMAHFVQRLQHLDFSVEKLTAEAEYLWRK